MSSPLENLETQLEMFIENVRQIRIIVSDFQPQGQSVLNQKIQSLVTGLQEVDKLKSQVHDIHVPTEVFELVHQTQYMVTFVMELFGGGLRPAVDFYRLLMYKSAKALKMICSQSVKCVSYIDQGRNPQLYTKDCIDKALAKNEEVKGKIDSYKRFKSGLLSELSKSFPNEIAKYKAIRGGE